MTNFTAVTIAIVDVATNIGVQKVRASCLGKLAAHASIGETRVDGSAIWIITHVTSGLRIGGTWGFESERDAVACLKVLHALPVDWSLTGKALKENHPNIMNAFEAIADICGGALYEHLDAQTPQGSA